jgi:hypothetical protein
MKKPIQNKNPMVQLLTEPDKGMSDTQDVLARIWRQLLYQTNVPVAGWFARLSNWQLEQSKTIGIKEAMCLKSNITGAVAKKRISWDNLMRGYSILGYVKLEITIVGYKAIKDHKGDKVELTVLTNQLNAEQD